MNMIDYYDIWTWYYYSMILYLVGTTLKIKVPLKVVQKYTLHVLDTLYNWAKIYDQLIKNAKIDREEYADINHSERNII